MRFRADRPLGVAARDAGDPRAGGLGGMFARRAEVQAARAADTAGVPFVESTVSICGIEEVAAAKSTPPWFQLYVMRDRAYAEDLMSRAQAVGSPVLVLTIDLALVGARHRDTRNAVVGEPPRWAKIRRGSTWSRTRTGSGTSRWAASR